MGTTGTYGLPFQELADAPDGAASSQNLAEAVETELERIDAALGFDYARITRAAQTLTHNVEAQLVLNTLTEETDPAFGDTVNGRLVIPRTGVYVLDASVTWASLPATGRRELGLFVDGAEIRRERLPVVTAINQVQNLACVARLAAGDLVTITGLHTAGADLEAQSAILAALYQRP